MRIHPTHLATFSLTIGLFGCGDDPASPEDQTRPCTDDTGTVAVTVTSGQAPTFAWDPSCSLAMLLVEEDASDMWGVATDEGGWGDPARANLIVPPVTYGVVPAGSSAFQDPLPLAAGTTYDLILWRVLPATSTAACVQRLENLCLMAAHAFVQ